MSGQLVIVALIAAACWLVSLWAWPWAPCRRCSGSGTNAGSNRRRFGECRRCHGTRRRQRLGSRALHRAVRGGAAYRRNRKE